MTEEKDPEVNGPQHYNGDECMVALEQAGWGREGCLFNIGKYLYRFQAKGRPLQDIQKAQWYVDRLNENGAYGKPLTRDEMQTIVTCMDHGVGDALPEDVRKALAQIDLRPSQRLSNPSPEIEAIETREVEQPPLIEDPSPTEERNDRITKGNIKKWAEEAAREVDRDRIEADGPGPDPSPEPETGPTTIEIVKSPAFKIMVDALNDAIRERDRYFEQKQTSGDMFNKECAKRQRMVSRAKDALGYSQSVDLIYSLKKIIEIGEE